MQEEAPKQEQTRPWEELAELVRIGSPDDVARFIDELPPGETSRVLSRLGEDDRGAVLRSLGASEAAGVVDEIPEVQAAEIIESLEPEEAAEILHELPSDEKADLLAEIDQQDAQAILAAMEPAEAEEVRQLAKYSEDVAGGLMATELLFYREDVTCEEIVNDLRRRPDEHSDYQLQYVYVTSPTDQLVGVLRLRDLLFTTGDKTAAEIMIPNPLRVREETSLEELGEFFDRHAFLGVPVVDETDQVLGDYRKHKRAWCLLDSTD